MSGCARSNTSMAPKKRGLSGQRHGGARLAPERVGGARRQFRGAVEFGDRSRGVAVEHLYPAARDMSGCAIRVETQGNRGLVDGLAAAALRNVFQRSRRARFGIARTICRGALGIETLVSTSGRKNTMPRKFGRTGAFKTRGGGYSTTIVAIRSASRVRASSLVSTGWGRSKPGATFGSGRSGGASARPPALSAANSNKPIPAAPRSATSSPGRTPAILAMPDVKAQARAAVLSRGPIALKFHHNSGPG